MIKETPVKNQDGRWNLFRTVQPKNYNAKAKKPASVSVRIRHLTGANNIYVKRVGGKAIVTGFQDPDTGLFITNLRSDDSFEIPAYSIFRGKALDYARDHLAEVFSSIEDSGEETKSTTTVTEEIYDMLQDRTDFYVDLDSQIQQIQSGARPQVNSYLAFKDDNIQPNTFVTAKVQYDNPLTHIPHPTDFQTVEDFLSVFVDNDNRNILAWYFGAMLSNVPVYDARISKMLVVSSSRGGSGKSTLIGALTKALLTDDFCDTKPSFDSVFSTSNHFAKSTLLPLRATVYSEADWNDANTEEHNFDGLDVSEIKSMISDGYISIEKKYEDMQTSRFPSFPIVLTNHAPEIDGDRSALNRRLLALVVQPNSMSEKGQILGLRSDHDIYQFVLDNVQKFADYFVQFFQAHQRLYTNLEYSSSDTRKEIADGEMNRVKALEINKKNMQDLAATDGLAVVADAAKRAGDDIDQLLEDILSAKNGHQISGMRYKDGELYLDSSNSFWYKYTALGTRAELKKTMVSTEKKFGMRVWKLALK